MTRTPRPVSARVRILGAILAVACVGLAIVGAITFLVQRERVLADIDTRLISQVASVSPAGDGAPSGGGTDAAPSDVTTVTEIPDPTRYTSVSDYLGDVVGRVVLARNEASVGIIDGVARFQPPELSGFSISADTGVISFLAQEATRDGGGVPASATTPEGTLRYIAVPISVAGDDREALFVRAVDLDAELAPVTWSFLIYAIAAVVMLIAIGIVCWFVAGRLLGPLRQLRDTADSITITDLGARLPTQGNDDISDLTRTVNSMLDRLEGSVDVQRNLLDDVRHELKTPITIVRGHLELMNPNDAADVENTREIGIAELDRMTRLVEDIDLLATAEADQFTMEEVDVASLTDRVGELVAVIPGHTWRIRGRAHGTVFGDDDRLLQAWLQLADNAAKYTPEDSPIEIGSTTDTGEVRLWVRDHGPGIPPAARHRIFRRFDRAHVKRSVGGSGLGLAIVDAITKAHGGHCSVGDTIGGGATFTIHVPLGTRATELPAPVRAGDVVLQRESSA
ncbi:sensor histidine kinase [Microbacterium sp. P01]|uniref:sensor histidine kinase n=1 Tax=unclassified Microbacterium TaxID=2609290 RepID=UPI00366C3B64